MQNYHIAKRFHKPFTKPCYRITNNDVMLSGTHRMVRYCLRIRYVNISEFSIKSREKRENHTLGWRLRTVFVTSLASWNLNLFSIIWNLKSIFPSYNSILNCMNFVRCPYSKLYNMAVCGLLDMIMNELNSLFSQPFFLHFMIWFGFEPLFYAQYRSKCIFLSKMSKLV